MNYQTVNKQKMSLKQTILNVKSVSFAWPGYKPSKQVRILSNISLCVHKGEVYGLLGASGCGKTTLLRLVLGQLSSSSGNIRLFDCNVDLEHKPTPLFIGYMPQDIVLYEEFTANEMLTYFGRLYKMSGENIVLRIDCLLQLLNLSQLTNSTKLICQLSGGQKRRISLAIALLHQPRMLILDEPTVGVDPILREVIWKHLNQLSSEQNVTVILTTHYIEEARGAHTIGFLRNGRLLAQEAPENLMKQHSVSTIEDVFLKLCRRDDHEQSIIEAKQCAPNNLLAAVTVSTTTLVSSCSNVNSSVTAPMDDDECSKVKRTNVGLTKKAQVEPSLDIPGTWLHIKQHESKASKTASSNHFICGSHLVTLVKKNFRQIYRNWSLLVFFTLLPAIEIGLIMLCIGRDIDNIPIAVYNAEKPHADLSQLFLESVPQNAFRLKFYDHPDKALQAVKLGEASALMKFSTQFSSALQSRFFSLGIVSAKNATGMSSLWDDSSVYVQLDMSNQLIGLQIQRQLLNTFLVFAQRLASTMGLSNDTFKPPVVFGPPVYGIQSSAVVETFIAPGALIMIAFFATTIVTCHLLIHEVRQALIERALIAGATTAEFLFSHILIQSTILMVQLFLMLLTAFHLFQMPYLGSLTLTIALISLQGLCGLMYGLMLSATCPDEIYATTLAIGTFFPSVIIGGIFWPIQSMPLPLQYLSHCMPTTQSIDALRSILLRNWNLTNINVVGAFVVSTMWLFVFLACALRNFKRRI